jgi:antitoxin PrlF
MVATLTSKGQITIPVEVRRKLDIHKGDRVSFVYSEGRCEIVAMHHSVRDLKGVLPKPAKRLSLADMDAAIADGARR